MNELSYQSLSDSHANSLLSIWSDKDVTRYTNIKSPCSLEEIKGRIKKLKDLDVFVVNKDENIIGIIGCPCINKEQSQYGLFYQFCKSAWGQGNATIATEWMLKFMYRKYKEVTLFADVVIDNIASEKILRNFGFKLISEESFERNGIKTKIHNYKK